MTKNSEKPCILMCAPNGARRTKSDHPSIPLSYEEIAICSEEIASAGASILHLHVRDDTARHSLAPERYKRAIAAIKHRIGDKLLIQITTESVGMYTREEQIATVKAVKPEAVSIALREICPTDSEIPSTTDFFSWMASEKIFPQIILYDEHDIVRFEKVRLMGNFHTATPFVLLVVGQYGAEHTPNTTDLLLLEKHFTNVPYEWAVCAFGKNEHKACEKSAYLGGHVRVGFENNLYDPDGNLVKNNKQLIEIAHNIIKYTPRKLASTDDVKLLFGL